jgi:hypothetical protein
MEKGNAQSLVASGVSRSVGSTEHAEATGVYTATCYDAQGNLKWTDTYSNVVTTVGKNFLLDALLSGSAYTAAWYLGLISLTSYVSTPVVGDTHASHATWVEDVGYSNSTRVAPSFGAASAGSKATTATAFNINATTTIKGTFLANQSAKSSVAASTGSGSATTNVLYSAGLFTGGDKAVASGDTLNVTYTASV